MALDQDLMAHPLEVLSEHQCRELLASRDLGRIAFSIGGSLRYFP